MLKDKFLTTATISHPYFRSVWIKYEIKKNKSVQDFTQAVIKISKSKKIEGPSNNTRAENTNEDELFFSWIIEKSTSTISIEN